MQAAHPDPDRLTQLDLREGWQVDHWTKKLGLSREELAKVVESTGNDVRAIEDYVRQWGRPATTD